MNCAYQPNGLLFIFDEATSKTLRRDIQDKADALFWIAKMTKDRLRADQPTSTIEG